MAYVAVKGGREAIEGAARAFRFAQVKGSSAPLGVAQIMEQLHFAVDKVMGEGSLYAPELAALAIKQSSGDLLEASFMLRAFCATQPRLAYSLPASTERMRVERRISAAFKDLPGGQVLGATGDYLLRLLDFDLADESEESHREARRKILEGVAAQEPLPESFPKVVEILKREGLLSVERAPAREGVFDVTREALSFPAPRQAALQSMARAETGGLLALAYSNMRGFGMVHPTVGELRVGWLPVRVTNPYAGEPELIGEIKVTEAEIISECRSAEDAEGVKFTLGYGLCLGHNETKAISMAVLDRSIQTAEPQTPSEDQEFVLLHTDGVEAMGFCNHFKLPHYVTFQSALDRLRRTREGAS